jgi:hypothetical protein
MVQMPAAQQPPAPTGAEIIGLVYNLGPTGSTFDPPARLTFTYNDSQLLHGLNAKDLKLAYWDDLGNKWVTLENENIDMINGTITADINHFSYYAIIGYLPPPAKFVVSTLVVSPTNVKIGEPVKAAVTVTNTGGVTGAYNVVLNVNGIEEDSKYISLDAGAQTIVEFLITKYLANNYNLEVNGQRASFIIINPPVSDTTPSEVQIPAPQSVPVLTPIVTQIQSAVPQEPSGLITKASKSAAEMKSAHETTVHLALLGEVIAIALVLSGLTAIIIFVRRRYLLRKG